MQLMNSATIPLIVAILLQIALGSVVFLANPKRAANQCFLLLSLAIIGWLFKQTASQTTGRELVVFITPSVLKVDTAQAQPAAPKK